MLILGKREERMIKLNKLTDYAVVVLGQLARHSGKVETATEVAVSTGLPLPTVSKILKILSSALIVTSHRGSGGGYLLERRADDVRVAEIIEAFEGPIALTACVDSAMENCSIEALCPMKGNWNTVNEAIRTALFNLTLADMITTTRLEKSKKTMSQGAAQPFGN